jgi:hypothetical protein
MATRPFAVGLLALIVPASLAAAQGLGDAAARERAKREKSASSRSYSNDDLERGRPTGSAKKKTTASSAASPEHAPSSTSDTATSSEAGAPSRRSESSESSEPREPRESREPARPPQSNTAALEARIKGLQDKLNPMSGSFIYGATGSGDANEEARVRSELQQAEAELAQARQSAPPPGTTSRQERNEPAP